MSQAEPTDPIEATTRTVQIIVGAMFAGVCLFLLVVSFLDLSPKPGQGNLPPQPLLTIVAGAVTAVLLPLSAFLPNVISNSLRKRLAEGKTVMPERAGVPGPKGDVPTLAAIYVNRTIIGAALNEGAAFLAAVAYMIEKNPIALGLGLALAGALLMRLPSRDRVAGWVEQQRELLESDRLALRAG